MTNWRILIEPWTRPAFHAWSRLARGGTLGVRVAALDPAGRVLLVRHTYLRGWWLPGGGVDRGESAGEAARRELREETGLIATAQPRLVSIHDNGRHFAGDHVLLYRVDAFETGERSSHGEIAETGWFDPAALPVDVNRPSARRLAEMFDGAPVDPVW